MAGVRKTANKGGKFHGWFTDATGKRKFFTGTRSRAETLRIAERLEDDHRQVRLGYRPAPHSAAKHRNSLVGDAKREYLAWGESQGGRGGKPWGATHARNRRSQLGWWQEQLGLETLADLDGILPRVEQALREMQSLGRAGKTLANYADTLSAFCGWCKQRGYLAEDPLDGLAAFDTTPQTQRRAITAEEITRLLEACAPHRRLMLETAFLSGLRANELRNLSIEHLDLKRGRLHLDAAWTKNRKPGFQPIPRSLSQRLQAFAESGEATRLYEKFYARSGTTLQAPDHPLLYVPTHTARDLDIDLKAAGIQKNAPGGKLDFHACRLAYINFVIESGVTVKEAQELARHSTPDLTMNVYGRTREDRLSQAVEKVAASLQTISDDEECATYVQRQAVGAETESATPFINRELRLVENGGGGGIRTRVRK
jgi:integrase